MSKENESEGLKQIYPNFYKADYYEILDIDKEETITPEQITEKFRAFKSNNKLTGEIVEAYNVLIAPIPRKMYQDARKDIKTHPKITDSPIKVFKENYRTNILKPDVSLYAKLLIDPIEKTEEHLNTEVTTNTRILLELFKDDIHAIKQITFAHANLKDEDSRAAYSKYRNDPITSEQTTAPIKIESWDKIKQEQIVKELTANEKDKAVKAEIKKLRSTFPKIKLMFYGKDYSQTEEKVIRQYKQNQDMDLSNLSTNLTNARKPAKQRG